MVSYVPIKYVFVPLYVAADSDGEKFAIALVLHPFITVVTLFLVGYHARFLARPEGRYLQR